MGCRTALRILGRGRNWNSRNKLSRRSLSGIFPIKAAYQFAAENGLGKQAETIRMRPFRYDRRGLRDRSSSIRSGYLIVLFQSKGLFERFQKQYWPDYETEKGKEEFRAYQK